MHVLFLWYFVFCIVINYIIYKYLIKIILLDKKKTRFEAKLKYKNSTEHNINNN